MKPELKFETTYMLPVRTAEALRDAAVCQKVSASDLLIMLVDCLDHKPKAKASVEQARLNQQHP